MAKSPVKSEHGSYALWTWTGIDNNDDIDPAEVDISPSELIIQNGGEPDGATMTVSGSLDNVYWTDDLVDPRHNPVKIVNTTTGSALRDHWLWIKPVLIGGGGDQSSNILLMARYSYSPPTAAPA